MRVSVISHACVVAANRGKLSALVAREGMTLQLVVPAVWHERRPRRRLAADPAAHEPYEVRILPARTLRSAVHWYRSGTLDRALREFKPDVVHVEEEPWSLAALQAALMKRHLRFALSLFTWENQERMLPTPARLVQRLVLNRVDQLVAGSTDAAAVMRARGYRGPVAVLPQHGVDLDQFSSAADTRRRKTDPGGFVVGYAGRLVAEKGVDLLLDAFRHLPADASLLLLGDGPSREAILRHAATNGLNGRVTLAGAVPHAAVPGYLALMDVLVLPSRTTPNWKEQFGHVLIEAMACGVPVIGSSSGEIPTVIGDAGLVFREDDRNELTICLERLRDVQTRRRLAEAGKARVATQYSNDAIAGRLAQVFRATRGPC